MSSFLLFHESHDTHPNPSILKPIVSSRGCQAFHDPHGDLFLFNLLSFTWTHLPPKNTLTGPQFLTSNIQKVVVSGGLNPRAFVIAYSFPFELKFDFCRPGDQTWRSLGSEGTTYYDVVCCDETNTVAALGPGFSVESWDLNVDVPVKNTLMAPSTFQHNYSDERYVIRPYLVSWFGLIFLVFRYIEEYESYDEEPVNEYPYKTVDFHVYMLDVNSKKWVKVVSLEEYAILLGGNHGTIVSTNLQHPEFVRNAIYFTDDYWAQLDEDCFYGGHDNGVFGLADGNIQEILDSQERKSKPPPFWVTIPRTDGDIESRFGGPIIVSS